MLLPSHDALRTPLLLDSQTTPKILPELLSEARPYGADWLGLRIISEETQSLSARDGKPEGEPDEIVQQAAQRVKADEDGKRVVFFAVGVDKADILRLSEIAVRKPVKLKGLNFVEMFVWLSRSTQGAARSKGDDQVALPPPGWGTV